MGASSPSVLYWWVEGLELDAGILGGEAPVHPYCVPVALLLPRSHLPPQSALVGNTAVQALPGHHPDFDLRHPFGKLRTGSSQLPCLGV